ncbi:MAG: prepilin-type N-terminal cleavage/methylation domain-containing protein [Akkermansiaceae bacterium]
MSARPRHAAGFSLIELMFSMAIGSIILILAATMLGSSGESYERVGGNVASEREARALLTQLASDLATARFHPDSVIEKSSATWPRDRLGFLCLQPAIAQTEGGQIGDLCAVHYYVKDLPIAGKTVRCLMRGFRESTTTFDALRDEQVSGLFAETGLDEPVAFGVIAFEARPKSRDDDGQWIDWVENDLIGPQALEVKLTIARRELAGKLQLPADWNGSGSTKLLGQPADADRNSSLEIFATTLRFGNHEGL